MKQINRGRTLAFLLGIFFMIIHYGSAFGQIKSWGIIADDAQRFQILPSFNNEAVLDRETGLIWQRTPSNTVVNLSYEFAQGQCITETSTGGRFGWRLPTIEEMMSLVKPGNDNIGNPLPPPPAFFNYDQDAGRFWTSTTSADDATLVYFFFITFVKPPNDPGRVGAGALRGGINGASAKVWCVRGGSGIDRGK